MDGLSERVRVIAEKPYERVTNFYERRFPEAGKKVSAYGCPTAISSCCPDIKKPDGSRERTNLHVILIVNSGGGKTELMRQLQDISYQDWFIGKVTESKFEKKLVKFNKGTIFINDFKRSLETGGFVKAFEGAVDGFVKRDTNDGEVSEENLEVATFGGGVYQDLKSKKLFSGFLQRMMPVFVTYDKEQQKEIGEQISAGFYDSSDSSIRKQDVVDYFKLIHEIQEGLAEYEKVTDFRVSKPIADSIKETWNSKIDKFGKSGKYFFRDIKYGFALCANLGLMRYFQREVDDGVLVLKKDDADKASRLMASMMEAKNTLMSTQKAKKSMREDY